MKKILLVLFLGLVLNSCSTEETDTKVYYELLPISRCEMPYRFTAGETYELNMIFKMPTTCHVFKGIYFEGDETTKTVAIQSIVYERNDCEAIDYNSATAPELTSEKFNFTAEGPGTTYTFKIWTGKNDHGEDTYYDIHVPVDN